MSLKVEISKLEKVYLLGVGGIGMSALARYFKSIGIHVEGFDKTPSSITDALIQEGIAIHFDENVDLLTAYLKDLTPERYLVIYTPAIPAEHKELIYIQEANIPHYKRSEVLGWISRSIPTLGVAGTHGKTTTSSLLAHILHFNNVPINAFLGGIANNFHSNLVLPREGEASWTVVEADEFDRSFLRLFPQMGIVTSMDPDHLDIYGTEEEVRNAYRTYVSQINEGGYLAYHVGLELNPKCEAHSYGFDEVGCDWKGHNLRIEQGKQIFDLQLPTGEIWQSIQSGLPGKHNLLNAIAASALAYRCGLNESQIKAGLASFAGVWRRFDRLYDGERGVYIDDYAHHPTELESTIRSARELFPGKELLGVFQPHLYSRTRDFLPGFIEALNLLDQVIVLDIYPAREKPILGITSELILDGLNMENKKLVKLGEAMDAIKASKFDVLLTLGAGDIDRLSLPIKRWLEE